MRLLYVDEVGDVALTEPYRSDIPPYAILSHTWGPAEDEILFTDIQNGTYKRKTSALKKISFCLNQIRKDGLKYVWIDTCCINKNDLPELSESINSMFRWYRNSAICYVYLSDISARAAGRLLEERLTESQWFTRGWTLQELIAPLRLQFHSLEGDFLGARVDLVARLSHATGLPEPVLRGCALEDYSSTMRRDWVLQRQTTKPEDKWYCMLGILGISMPTIYGEGEDNAYKRLLSAIKDEHDRRLYSQPLPSSVRQSRPISVPLTKPIAEGSAAIASASTQMSIHSMVNDEKHRVELIKSLGFAQMDARKASLKRAHARTCAWFQEHPDYLTWRAVINDQENHGFLWIKGKPGAGKSTLMKFTLSRAEKELTEKVILVSFFFNARGENLEKSTIGMYRSLLHQIFIKAPHLSHCLNRYLPSRTRSNSMPTWTIDMMKDLFDEVIDDLGGHHLRCFIDALDECDEQEIREMIEHFEELGEKAVANGTKLSICLASRHYPSIDIRRGLKIILEDQSGHKLDIHNYIESRLKTGDGKIVEQIKQRLQEKANGVFMWTKLVLDILEPEIRRGRMYAVQSSLEEIPSELSALFRDILRRDTTNMDELLLCLQWMLFAKRPLARQEFYFAIVAGTDTPGNRRLDMRWDPGEITQETMDRFILNATKGLAAVTKSDKPTVQFIHESVRDFLLKDGGLYEIWPNVGQEPRSLSHNRLKDCCARYLFDSDCWHALQEPESYFRIERLYPFMLYSNQYVLHHANEAQENISQLPFLAKFPITPWTMLRTSLSGKIEEQYRMSTSLEYICAAQKHARLVRAFHILESHALHRGTQEPYRYPILVAFKNDDYETLGSLLPDVDSDEWRKALAEKPLTGIDPIYFRSAEPVGWALKHNCRLFAKILWRSPHYKKHGVNLNSIVALAVRHGNIELLEQVDREHHRPGLGSYDLDAVLTRTSEKRASDEYMNQLLLPENHRIDSHAAYEPWCLGEENDSIIFAAQRGSLRIVELLLKWTVHLHDTSACNIAYAMEKTNWKNHFSIIEVLLDNYVNKRCLGLKLGLAIYRALSLASASVLYRLIDVALATESEDFELAFNIKPHIDELQSSPDGSMHQFIARIGGLYVEFNEALQYAASNGDIATVELLLKFRSHPDFISESLSDAMLAASVSKHKETMHLLLDGIEDQVLPKGQCTSLGLAACYGLLDYAVLLLDHGTDVNAASCTRLQPLSLACWAGHLTLVNLLLSRGAKLTSEGLPTQPPLTGLRWEDCLPVKVPDYGPRRSLYSTGMTVAAPLSIAAARGHLDIVKALIALGADVDEGFDKNENALYMSTLAGHHMVCRYLLQSGARLHVESSRNMGTELYVATTNLDRQLVELLLESGARADINARGGLHGTAIEATFFICSMKDQLHKDRMIRDIVEMLLDNGACLNFNKVQSAVGNLLEDPHRSPFLLELLIDRFPEEVQNMMMSRD